MFLLSDISRQIIKQGFQHNPVLLKLSTEFRDVAVIVCIY